MLDRESALPAPSDAERNPLSRPLPILELTPSGVRLSPGSGAPWSFCEVDPEDLERSWSTDLGACDAALEELLDRHSLRGPRVQIRYKSPRSTAELHSLPLAGAAALEAALLSVGESFGSETAGSCSAVSILGRDPSNSRVHHVIGVADLVSHVEAVWAWAERAGCAVQSVVPTHAVTLSETVAAMLRDRGEGTRAYFLLDVDSACVGASVDGGIAFARPIDIGLSTISDPLAQLGVGGCDSQEGRIELLARMGVPAPRTVADEELGIQAKDVLPLIQPVLQRVFVEVKQSLRFNLPRERTGETSINVIGAGARVPRLAEALGDHLELNVSASEPSPSRRSSPALPVLRPPARGAAVHARRLRGALVGGGIAAALMLGADAWFAMERTEAAQQQLAAVQPTLQQQVSGADGFDRDLGSVVSLNDAVRAIDAEAGPRWMIGPAMREIAARAPESLLIRHMRSDIADGRARLVLDGYAWKGESADATRVLRDFIATLEESALVRDVRLGTTQRLDFDWGEATGFTLSLVLEGVERRWGAAQQEGAP